MKTGFRGDLSCTFFYSQEESLAVVGSEAWIRQPLGLAQHVVLEERGVELGRDEPGVGGRLQEGGDEVGPGLAADVVEPEAALLPGPFGENPRVYCAVVMLYYVLPPPGRGPGGGVE